MLSSKWNKKLAERKPKNTTIMIAKAYPFPLRIKKKIKKNKKLTILAKSFIINLILQHLCPRTRNQVKIHQQKICSWDGFSFIFLSFFLFFPVSKSLLVKDNFIKISSYSISFSSKNNPKIFSQISVSYTPYNLII